MTHTITVEPSGRSFQAEAGEPMLTAGIRQGIGLPYGCKDGACGSCKVKKLSGQVTLGPHQDKALSAKAEAATAAAGPATAATRKTAATAAGQFRTVPARTIVNPHFSYIIKA